MLFSSPAGKVSATQKYWPFFVRRGGFSSEKGLFPSATQKNRSFLLRRGLDVWHRRLGGKCCGQVGERVVDRWEDKVRGRVNGG